MEEIRKHFNVTQIEVMKEKLEKDVGELKGEFINPALYYDDEEKKAWLYLHHMWIRHGCVSKSDLANEIGIVEDFYMNAFKNIKDTLVYKEAINLANGETIAEFDLEILDNEEVNLQKFTHLPFQTIMFDTVISINTIQFLVDDKLKRVLYKDKLQIGIIEANSLMERSMLKIINRSMSINLVPSERKFKFFKSFVLDSKDNKESQILKINFHIKLIKRDIKYTKYTKLHTGGQPRTQKIKEEM